jgi:hypothetical protein
MRLIPKRLILTLARRCDKRWDRTEEEGGARAKPV